VYVPAGFVPSDVDFDGVDENSAGKTCPGYDPSKQYRPSWGGGFRAVRVRDGKQLFHRALDVMAAEGAVLRAVSDCYVVASWVPRAGELAPGAGFSAKGGNYVVLVDDAGWRWYYAHMRDLPLVQPGDRVMAGQQVGYVGRTGNARRTVHKADGTSYFYGCPHLHVSLTVPPGTMGPYLNPVGGTPVDRDGDKVDVKPFYEPVFDTWDIE
jgi:murein DD-endopeptidase MepM/ murein hydrolase activator NlpD